MQRRVAIQIYVPRRNHQRLVVSVHTAGRSPQFSSGMAGSHLQTVEPVDNRGRHFLGRCRFDGICKAAVRRRSVLCFHCKDISYSRLCFPNWPFRRRNACSLSQPNDQCCVSDNVRYGSNCILNAGLLCSKYF